MDKKTYISPSITIMRVNPTSLMEGSNTTNLPLEIDDSGQYSDEAGAKRCNSYNVWDDDL
jgi:hypothetical protein